MLLWYLRQVKSLAGSNGQKAVSDHMQLNEGSLLRDIKAGQGHSLYILSIFYEDVSPQSTLWFCCCLFT
jgi:hypothetical protein